MQKCGRQDLVGGVVITNVTNWVPWSLPEVLRKIRLYEGNKSTKFVGIMFTNWVSTSKKIYRISSTKIGRLIFGDAIAVYCDNRTEHINSLCARNEALPDNVLQLCFKEVHILNTRTSYEIWGSHGGNDVDAGLPSCDAVWSSM
jgi:hypothetical protein